MVFRLKPDFHAYRWSEANVYFAHGKADSISIGGGGHFALWLGDSLTHGSSNTCETFQSPCLASSVNFAVQKLEVWAFE